MAVIPVLIFYILCPLLAALVLIYNPGPLVSDPLRAVPSQSVSQSVIYLLVCATAKKAMELEPVVPRMYTKHEWDSLPEKLQIGDVFRCRADCDAIAMAYAESKDFGLRQKNADQTLNRNYGCCGWVSLSLSLSRSSKRMICGYRGTGT